MHQNEYMQRIRIKKKRPGVRTFRFGFRELFFRRDDFLAVVVAAVRADAVRHLRLVALRAYGQSRCALLHVVRATRISHSFGCSSLRGCHLLHLLYRCVNSNYYTVAKTRCQQEFSPLCTQFGGAPEARLPGPLPLVQEPDDAVRDAVRDDAPVVLLGEQFQFLRTRQEADLDQARGDVRMVQDDEARIV